MSFLFLFYYNSKAPPVLAAHIARHIADEILKEDHNQYLEVKTVEQPQWEGEDPVPDETCRFIYIYTLSHLENDHDVTQRNEG